jgi:hypothetical protein
MIPTIGAHAVIAARPATNVLLEALRVSAAPGANAGLPANEVSGDRPVIPLDF